MRRLAVLALMVWLVLPGVASAARRSRPAATKTTKKTVPKKTVSSKKTVASSKGRRSVAGKKTRKGRKTLRASRPRQTWRTGQMAPTRERYIEVQQALVAKGYSHENPDGNWDEQWVEALKQFQHDQSLDTTGKLNSLSIIGLGLGPRRETGEPSGPPPSGNTETEPATRESP